MDGVQHYLRTWTLTEDREDAQNARPAVHLDSPKDDFDDIRGPHGAMYYVPAYRNSSRGIVGLLLQRKNGDGDVFRRVGLSVIVHWLGAPCTFLDDQEQLRGVEWQDSTIF